MKHLALIFSLPVFALATPQQTLLDDMNAHPWQLTSSALGDSNVTSAAASPTTGNGGTEASSAVAAAVSKPVITAPVVPTVSAPTVVKPVVNTVPKPVTPRTDATSSRSESRTTAKAAAAPSFDTIPVGSWAIQVAALSSREAAERRQQELASTLGEGPFRIAHVKHWRVLYGSYPDRKTAQKALAELKKDRKAEGFVTKVTADDN